MQTATEGKVLEITYWWPCALAQFSHSRSIPSIRKSGIKFVVSVIGSDRKLKSPSRHQTATLVKHLMRIISKDLLGAAASGSSWRSLLNSPKTSSHRFRINPIEKNLSGRQTLVVGSVNANGWAIVVIAPRRTVPVDVPVERACLIIGAERRGGADNRDAQAHRAR